MPSWWGKSSSKDSRKKCTSGSFIDSIRKLKILSYGKWKSKSATRHRRETLPENERRSISTLSSRQISLREMFGGMTLSQPLPIPEYIDFGISAEAKPEFYVGSESLGGLPLPRPQSRARRVNRRDASGDLATGSVSSDSSADSNEASDSLIFSLQASESEVGNASASNSPSSNMSSWGYKHAIGHSHTVSPLHSKAGGIIESPTSLAEDGKQLHRLPIPPVLISKPASLPPSYSSEGTPLSLHSPGKAESSMSFGSYWKKGRLLGRGTFGHVYLGFNSMTGEMCAIKEVTLFSDDAKSRESAQQLVQEITLLSRLHHPNIVQYHGSGTVDDKLYIYLDYVSGGSIHKLLQEYGHFEESAIRSYTHQILAGLAYLHARNTVHRDIKGANILVDPTGRVKLADFGMAKHITGFSLPLSFKGSPYWMAPEVITNSSPCTLAVDIWSLGCTVLEMASTKPPWSQYEGVAAMFKIGNSKELPEIPNHLSDEAKDFVRRCLQRNPSHRPTAAQLLGHPFVKNAASIERQALCFVPSATSSVMTMVSNSQMSSSTRNRSCPVSPTSSPLVCPVSPHRSGRISPLAMSSPHAASGTSTPRAGGSVALSSHHSIHSNFNMLVPRSQNDFHNSNTASYLYVDPVFLEHKAAGRMRKF